MHKATVTGSSDRTKPPRSFRTIRDMGACRLRDVVTASIVSLWVLGPGLVSAQGTPTDQLILRHQRALQRNPTDARAYYRLGDACVQKARETGDVGYFVLAERALRKSLDLAPRQSGALRHLAYVLYARHEFREAAAYARRAIKLDGSDGHAYGILGDAHLEVG